MRVLQVLGLGYGDEGKGAMVNYLAQEHAHDGPVTVMRSNGGAQAAHNVVTNDGRHHTFAQFGSGTFAGAQTFLSKHMVFNPPAFMAEARHLEEVGVRHPCSMVAVDGDALVTTRYHIAANRIRELARTDGRHGSCGIGIGETVAYALAHPADALRVRDIGTKYFEWKMARTRVRIAQDLEKAELVASNIGIKAVRGEWGCFCSDYDYGIDIRHTMAQAISRGLKVVDDPHLGDVLHAGGTLIVEGAQGVLLDEDYGFHPYTTWSHCTFRNAEDLIERACVRYGANIESTRIGVIRSYMTRHGAGPLVTEDPAMQSASTEHNVMGLWQQNFRMGHPDMVTLRYAADVVGRIDELAITHMDRLSVPLTVCTKYDLPPEHQGVVDAYGHLCPPHGLDQQAQVTAALLAAKPVYTRIAGAVSLERLFGDAARAPVRYVGLGPKAVNICDIMPR